MLKKNIVICCDGTGNDFGANKSNVVKLFSVLEKNSLEQVVYYDPGVGTPSAYSAFLPTTQTLMRWFGLAFGYGISQNILDAYAFLMTHYNDGDDVYLFGFSRGAYTARAVAGLVHKCGLLQPDNTNLLPEAMRIFKRKNKKGEDDADQLADDFKATFCRIPFLIKFLGTWDTVSSVGWIYSPTHFPYTTRNPSVIELRHAISLDERRAFFRQNLFKRHKEAPPQQKIKQVWFAGVHSDVGGGYPDSRSGLSNIAFEWMLLEAMEQKLMVDRLYKDRKIADSYPGNHLADQNEELAGWWWLGEIWPKLSYIPRTSLYWPFSWFYASRDGAWLPHFNLSRRRYTGDQLTLHESVTERIKARPDYRPSNLVDRNGKYKMLMEVEPWKRL